MLISQPNRYFIIFSLACCIFACRSKPKNKQVEKVVSVIEKDSILNYVNLFIGTERGEHKHPGARGNTHPGATTPWGMTACSPQTFDFREVHSPTGFRSGMDTIYGFSTMNFSGIGCPALGSIPFKFYSRDFNTALMGSSFEQQRATPGLYKVYLKDEDISVAATTTTRSALYKLELPKGTSKIFLDLTAQQGHVKGGIIQEYGNEHASGFQLEGFFCGSDTKSRIFFHTSLDDPADGIELVYENPRTKYTEGMQDEPSGIIYTYKTDHKKSLLIRVGVSFVSTENAKDNVLAEQADKNFELIFQEAQNRWTTELSKIEIASNDINEKTVFYTALYHSLLMPITFSDTNGQYLKQGSLDEIGIANDHVRYTGFSLWDTYRTLHPLLTLVYPQQQLDMVKTMIGMYEEAGRLPKWEIFGQEPNIMVGDPAPIVIADSYVKGVDTFNARLALEAIMHQANVPENNFIRRGLKEYLELGYLSMDGEFSNIENFQWKNGIVWGPVSTTMEFNLADYGIAQMARAMGATDIHKTYSERAISFLKLYDDGYGMMRPKNRNGSWFEPFDPTQERYDKMNFGLRGGPGFVEGSAWQYLYSIPHGIDELRQKMGDNRFEQQLDKLFEEGHFDMTNEPGLGFPFMYNYLDPKSRKTSTQVHQCIETYFKNTTDGLPGNDDAGTMSAWLVFAAMGIYPDTPGDPDYMVTIPSFEQVKIHLDSKFYDADTFTINRQGPRDGIITSISVNDVPLTFKLSHQDIVDKNTFLTINTR